MIDEELKLFVVVEAEEKNGLLVAGMNKMVVVLKPREKRNVALVVTPTELGVLNLPQFKIVIKGLRVEEYMV